MKLPNCHWKTPHFYSMFWKARWVTLALERDLISCLFVMLFACVFSATRHDVLVQALVLKSGVFWWHFANFIILCQYNNVCQLFFVISQRLLNLSIKPFQSGYSRYSNTFCNEISLGGGVWLTQNFAILQSFWWRH